MAKKKNYGFIDKVFDVLWVVIGIAALKRLVSDESEED